MAEREIYDPTTGQYMSYEDYQALYGPASAASPSTPVRPGPDPSVLSGYGPDAPPEEPQRFDNNPPGREAPPDDTVTDTTTPTGHVPTGGFGYLTEPFNQQAPIWKPGPVYTAPKWEPPPAFSYKQFEAPTPDSIYADPSYQFREGQGRRALEQSAAGRGTLRSGGTLKDLINYGQNAASQEYSNIYGRAVDAHNMGLQQELGTYGVNYGVSKDNRDYLYDASKAEFAPLQRESEQMNQRDFDAFLANYDIFDRDRRRAGDYLTWAAEQGAS